MAIKRDFPIKSEGSPLWDEIFQKFCLVILYLIRRGLMSRARICHPFHIKLKSKKVMAIFVSLECVGTAEECKSGLRSGVAEARELD